MKQNYRATDCINVLPDVWLKTLIKAEMFLEDVACEMMCDNESMLDLHSVHEGKKLECHTAISHNKKWRKASQ